MLVLFANAAPSQSCYYVISVRVMIVLFFLFLLVLLTVIKYIVILEIPVLFLKLCSMLGAEAHWGHNKEQGINAAPPM
jgi:hypothetical protein